MIETQSNRRGKRMNQKLSSWWEEKTQHPYVAKRSLIAPAHADKFAPFTHFIVYYCGADFSPPQIPLQGAELGYLIQGEKEPPNAPDQDPWVPRAEQLLDVVGGALRQDPVEIIPVLYVSMGFGKQNTTRSFSSDQVPINEDANRTVRVVCGQFENAVHPVAAPQQVTVLDVVLPQGGKFTWNLPANQQAFIYVVGGNVQIGTQASLANCRADTLVWATGKRICISAACAGGRFLVGTVPCISKPNAQESYVQEILPDLDRAKTK